MSKMANAQGLIFGSSGYDNTFSLTLDRDGEPVSDVNAVLKTQNTNIIGTYDEENECYWFTIPADLAEGEHFYNVTVDGETLIFPQKMIFM